MFLLIIHSTAQNSHPLQPHKSKSEVQIQEDMLRFPQNKTLGDRWGEVGGGAKLFVSNLLFSCFFNLWAAYKSGSLYLH